MDIPATQHSCKNELHKKIHYVQHGHEWPTKKDKRLTLVITTLTMGVSLISVMTPVPQTFMTITSQLCICNLLPYMRDREIARGREGGRETEEEEG